MNAHSAIHVRQLTLSLLLILLLFDQSLAQGPMITDAVLEIEVIVVRHRSEAYR